jgi:hypothetical protein
MNAIHPLVLHVAGFASEKASDGGKMPVAYAWRDAVCTLFRTADMDEICLLLGSHLAGGWKLLSEDNLRLHVDRESTSGVGQPW